MFATLSIPHPNGAVESITSADIERLYAMTVAEYVAFVAKEPLDDGGQMLRERRLLVESGAIAQKAKPQKRRAQGHGQQASKKHDNAKAGQSNPGKPRRKLRKVSKAKTTTAKKQPAQPRKKLSSTKANPKKMVSTRPANAMTSKPREIGSESIGPMGLPRLRDMTPSYRTATKEYNHTPMGPELTDEERKQRWVPPERDFSHFSGSNSSRHNASPSYRDPSEYDTIGRDD